MEMLSTFFLIFRRLRRLRQFFDMKAVILKIASERICKLCAKEIFKIIINPLNVL